MIGNPPHLLCINPWIHDFAAYDFWAKPMGLLQIIAVLRSHGIRVSYLDCLDRFHPMEKNPVYSADGRGPYRKTRIATPHNLSDMSGTYYRYGVDPGWFEVDLVSVGKPDLILVTSLMTYWYTGVKEAIASIKRIYPDVPVILGGIYATLMQRHAEAHTGADEVIPGAGEQTVFKAIEKHTGFALKPEFDLSDMNAFPYPAFDMQSAIPYVPLLTTRGCPNRCAYCASHILQPRRMIQDPDRTVAEIVYWHEQFGVRNFVFYDDALLLDPENHVMPLLEKIIDLKKDLSFHTPNAIHVRPISPAIARLMYESGFKNIRLGLETIDPKRKIDDKVCHEEFIQAVRSLREAGFEPDRLGAYLLAGLPEQDIRSVEAAIDIVRQCGIKPVLAYYTPIPGTRMWPAACRESRYDLEADPLFTNNSLMPCMAEYERRVIDRLKERARGK